MRGASAGAAVCWGVTFVASHVGAAALAAPRPAPEQTVGNPVAAVWKETHIDFVYMGRTVRYSCDGLRDKVRALLLDLGARRDLKIAAVGCDTDRLHNNSPNTSLSLTFSAPALPNPTAKPLHEGDLAATDARFETFTIASDAFRNLGVGDCELVEEFTQQILSKLVTRDLKHDITCVPYQLSGSRFLVKGEILKPLPPAEQAVGQQKAAGRQRPYPPAKD
jgi:hypothetical protein